MGRLRDRLRPAIASIRMALADPDLRRLLTAWFSTNAAKSAYLVVTSVVAFESGGVFAVGVMGLAQFVPQMIVAPFSGLPTARWSTEAVLRGVLVARTMAVVATAGIIAGALPIEALYAAVATEAAVSALTRPLYLALLPAVARTPAQLVGSNVASSAAESLGTFAGPAVAATLLAVSGPVAATIAVAAMCMVGAISIVTVAVPTIGRSTLTARAIVDQLAGGLRIVIREPGPRMVFIGIGAQTFVRGLVSVLIVVLAVDLLGIGDAGVGTLNAALGFGGLLGAAAATLLAGGSRLGNAFTGALAGWGLPIAIIGIVVDPVVAVVALLLVGMSNAVLDIATDTLVQRHVPHASQVSVIGLMEFVINGSIALGAIAAPAVIATLGIERALIAAGAILPLVAIVLWPLMRRVDVVSVNDEQAAAIVRAEPLFAPMSLASVEYIASRLEFIQFDDGADLIREGDRGDAFFLIDVGHAVVMVGGASVRTLGPGSSCGEVALLEDVPRTATVRAVGPVVAARLSREAFLEAVTGHRVSRGIAVDRLRAVHAADQDRVVLH